MSRGGRAWLASGNEGLSLSGGFSFRAAGGFDTGGAARLPEAQTGHLARGWDGKLLFAPALGHELLFSADFFEYPDLPRFHEITVQPKGGPSQQDARFAPNDRRFLHARYRYNLPLAFMDRLELHLGEQRVNDNRSRIPVGGAHQEFEQNRSTLSGLTAQALSTLGEGWLVFGGELHEDQVDSAKQCQPLAGACGASATVPTFPDGAKQNSAGLYLNAEWRPLDMLLLDGGLRYSQVRTELAPTPLSAAQTVEDDTVTGHVGSALTLMPGLVWTANFARGFRAPNIFDLGALGPRAGSNQINVPNPNLAPETLHGVDSGFKWSRGGLRAEAIAFYTEYEDRIEAREPTGNTIPNGAFGCNDPAGCPEVRSENISQARYWGWESGAFWKAAPALEIFATLNLTRGAERRAGGAESSANRVPPASGRAGALWRGGEFSVEPYLLFAGEQRRLDADDERDIRIAPGGTPGWATLNLRLGWTPRRLALRLEGYNLLDADYREHGSGIDGAGRALVAGASYSFK